MADVEVRYGSSGGAYVAYQVLGTGARDLLVVMEGFISVDMVDDEPRLARAMARLGSFARLIRFDRRGIGLSVAGQFANSAAGAGQRAGNSGLSG